MQGNIVSFVFGERVVQTDPILEKGAHRETALCVPGLSMNKRMSIFGLVSEGERAQRILGKIMSGVQLGRLWMFLKP